jgi:hypothetical protein
MDLEGWAKESKREVTGRQFGNFRYYTQGTEEEAPSQSKKNQKGSICK